MRLYDYARGEIENAGRKLKNGLVKKIVIGTALAGLTIPNFGCYYLIRGDYNLVKAVTFREDKEGYKGFGKDALIVGVIAIGGAVIGGGGGGGGGGNGGGGEEGPGPTPIDPFKYYVLEEDLK